MRSAIALGTLLMAATLTFSCTDQNPKPTAPADEGVAATADASEARNFTAPVRGAAEVPPRPTDAVGSAGFQLSRDGQRLQYLLLVGRIDNVTQAHIHIAPPGENGPIVAWLYPGPPEPRAQRLIPGEFNGVLDEGVITAADLVGPLAGQPLSALVAELRAGRAYVNVHTTQFPPGEIRGQITHLHVID